MRCTSLSSVEWYGWRSSEGRCIMICVKIESCFGRKWVKWILGKLKSCSRIKEETRRLVLGEDEVPRIWKDYFEYLHNIDTQEQVVFHVCGVYYIQRGNYFGAEPIRRTEVELSVWKLRNCKAKGKDEITGEMVEGGGVVEWWTRFGDYVIWLWK